MTSFVNKNVLIVGGTSGIGQAIALALASAGANVAIAGRNPTFGAKTLEQLKQRGPDHTHEFFQFDASSIASNKTLLSTLQSQYDARGGLHLLFLTIGGLTNGVRKETPEGHEQYLAFQGLSRYILAAGLAKQLEAVKGAIWSIMAGAMGNKFDINDLELKKGYGLTSVMNRDSGIQDVVTAEYVRRHPSVWYNHVYPGIVNTDLGQKHELNFVLRFLIVLASWIVGWSPDGYAQMLLKTVAKDDRTNQYWHPKEKRVTPKPWTQDPEVGKKVVEALEKETGVNL